MFLGYKLASSDSLSFEIEGAAPYQHCLSCLSKSWDDELMKAKRMWFGVAAAVAVAWGWLFLHFDLVCRFSPFHCPLK